MENYEMDEYEATWEWLGGAMISGIIADIIADYMAESSSSFDFDDLMTKVIWSLWARYQGELCADAVADYMALLL